MPINGNPTLQQSHRTVSAALRLLPLVILALPVAAFASGGDATENLTARHMTELVLQLGIIILAARLFAALFTRLKLPSVLGELTAGIIIGPYVLGTIALPSFPGGLFPLSTGAMPVSEPLYGIATIASIILLFLAGIETDFALLMRFSVAGLLTGIGGVVLSLTAGILTCALMTGYSAMHPVSLFLGVICTATSVGITVRILTDRKRLDTPEGVTILAAAVIDDIIGVILLAVLTGFVSLGASTGRHTDWAQIAMIAVRAVGIWLFFTVTGIIFASRLSGVLKRCGSPMVISILALALALILSAIFEKAGLALIIGAYVMGLSLSMTDLRNVIHEQLRPVHAFVVPVFFAVMGMLVNVRDLFSLKIALIGTVFTLAAVAAKLFGCGIPALFCGFNILGATRIGMGMIPRGEVALIIAGIGLSNGILTHDFFAIAIFMTIATTLVTPIVLDGFLRNPARGTRKEISFRKHAQSTFDLAMPELASFVASRALDTFRREGFYVHQLDEDKQLYHIQRENVVVELSVNNGVITLECPHEQRMYTSTLVYESIVELQGITEKLRDTRHFRQVKQNFVQADLPGSPRQSEDVAGIISSAHIIMNLKAGTSDGIIAEIVDGLHRTRHVNDPHQATLALLEREKLASTGMQFGVAIPHARTDAVNHICVAIAFKRDGIDFGATDSQPSTVFVCMLYPQTEGGPHLEMLAYIAGKLGSAERVAKLLACAGPQDVLWFMRNE